MTAVIVTAKYKGENSPTYTHGESYLLRVSADANNRIIIQQLVEKEKVLGKVDYVDVLESLTKYDSIITFLYLWEEITSYPTIDVDDVF